MKIDGTPYRAIWPGEDGVSACIIDQTRLPHEFVTVDLRSVDEAATAFAKNGDALLGKRIEVWHAQSDSVQAGWFAGTVSDVRVEQVQLLRAHRRDLHL